MEKIRWYLGETEFELKSRFELLQQSLFENYSKIPQEKVMRDLFK